MLFRSIHDIKALVLDIQVPQVYPQVIRTNKSLPVRVNTDAVDVVGMRICIRPSRHSSHNRIMVRQSWELEVIRTVKVDIILRANCTTATCSCSRSKIVREIVLSNDF